METNPIHELPIVNFSFLIGTKSSVAQKFVAKYYEASLIFHFLIWTTRSEFAIGRDWFVGPSFLITNNSF